jgi:hypothetical protein
MMHLAPFSGVRALESDPERRVEKPSLRGGVARSSCWESALIADQIDEINRGAGGCSLLPTRWRIFESQMEMDEFMYEIGAKVEGSWIDLTVVDPREVIEVEPYRVRG